jgi:carbonic anhydrase/acetyltransferase-like protein (isoleucine patch superfamily)
MIRSVNGKTPKIADSAFVSETACIIGDVEIGDNSSIWPGAVIRGDMGKITIGKNVAIEDNCVIHSGTPTIPWIGDVTIGDSVVFGHGAISNGRKIGNNTMVSMGATILHDAEIGEYSLIAAGCVVKEKMVVPPRSFVVGVPAKIKGEISKEQTWWSENSPDIYVEWAQKYKAEGLDVRDLG